MIRVHIAITLAPTTSPGLPSKSLSQNPCKTWRFCPISLMSVICGCGLKTRAPSQWQGLPHTCLVSQIGNNARYLLPVNILVLRLGTGCQPSRDSSDLSCIFTVQNKGKKMPIMKCDERRLCVVLHLQQLYRFSGVNCICPCWTVHPLTLDGMSLEGPFLALSHGALCKHSLGK